MRAGEIKHRKLTGMLWWYMTKMVGKFRCNHSCTVTHTVQVLGIVGSCNAFTPHFFTESPSPKLLSLSTEKLASICWHQ